MASYSVQSTHDDENLTFTLTRHKALGLAKAVVPYLEWDSDAHPAVSLLLLLVKTDTAMPGSDSVSITHETVASMPPADTALLGLPAPCPYALRLQAKGAVSDPRFQVRTLWLDERGTEIVGLARTGCLLEAAGARFLVREPLFSLLEAIDRVNLLVDIAQAAIDPRIRR